MPITRSRANGTTEKGIKDFYPVTKRPHSPKRKKDEKLTGGIETEKKENTPTKKARLEGEGYHGSTPVAVVRAKRRLGLDQTSFKVIGRENEMTQLAEFIRDKVKNKKAASLYVSGLPGTGKTMVVRRAVEDLKDDLKYRLVWINCMNIESISDFSARIGECVDVKRKTPLKRTPSKVSAADVESWFTTGRQMNLLCLDEIDQLKEKAASTLQKVFEWPMLPGSNVILIGIANSFDLTDRSLKKLKLKGNIEPQLLHFRPYGTEEVVAIVKDRLSEYADIMHPQSIELCARKCAAISGDVRKALETCKIAVERAALGKSNGALQSLEPIEALCGSSEVLAALQDVYAPTKRNCHYVTLPLQQKLIFAAALSLSSSSLKQFTVEKLYDEYKRICSVAHIPAIDSSETRNLCDLLESNGLLRQSIANQNSKYILNINEKNAREIIDDDHLLTTLLQN